MPECELCGAKENSLIMVKVDRAVFKVCTNCEFYGTRVEEKALSLVKPKIQEQVPISEVERIIVPNYAQLASSARQRLGLKQEEIAKQLNEKISVIQAIETGKYMPDLKLAAKLAKFFKIKLIEEV